MKSRMLAAWTALPLALALTNCAQNPVSGRANFVTMSETQEVQTGRQEDVKVRQEYGVYDNKALQQYVNEVGQRLGKASHRPQLQYTYVVVDSPEINAFALPGGYIYVTRGILAYLNSEAELAAVLGHETGHVTARHGVQQMSAATAAGVGATLVGIFVPALRNQAGDTAIGLLGNVLLSGYGREHELEADKLGSEYLYRTGYDPQAMIKVIGVLKNQELFDAEVAKAEGRQPRSYHGVFASHPDADQRLQEVVGEAGKLAGSGRVNQEEFLRMIDKVPFGYSESQGFVRNFTFYHRELGLVLKFPDTWRINNKPDSVSASNRGDDVMIEMRLAGRAQGAPADILRKQIGNPREITSTTINGLPAAIATTSIRGLPTRAAVVFLGKSAYLIGGQAKTEGAMQQALAAINATITSFHAMSETERNSERPLTLRVINAPPGATFAELARSSPLGKNAVSYLRLLNGLYPQGEPAAGQALKIVE
ncbi:MAG: M48 family metalloprotease [Proteobacteria bacterium]|nr:M48 family metalloprotease [Pseudomonadota bacterium]